MIQIPLIHNFTQLHEGLVNKDSFPYNFEGKTKKRNYRGVIKKDPHENYLGTTTWYSCIIDTKVGGVVYEDRTKHKEDIEKNIKKKMKELGFKENFSKDNLLPSTPQISPEEIDLFMSEDNNDYCSLNVMMRGSVVSYNRIKGGKITPEVARIGKGTILYGKITKKPQKKDDGKMGDGEFTLDSKGEKFFVEKTTSFYSKVYIYKNDKRYIIKYNEGQHVTIDVKSREQGDKNKHLLIKSIK